MRPPHPLPATHPLDLFLAPAVFSAMYLSWMQKTLNVYLNLRNSCYFPCWSLTTPYFFTIHNLKIKAIVFDKTGTITHGRPEVAHVMVFVTEKMCPHQLFTAIVGLAESKSEHPLGVAVTEFARKVGNSVMCT